MPGIKVEMVRKMACQNKIYVTTKVIFRANISIFCVRNMRWKIQMQLFSIILMFELIFKSREATDGLKIYP